MPKPCNDPDHPDFSDESIDVDDGGDVCHHGVPFSEHCEECEFESEEERGDERQGPCLAVPVLRRRREP